MSSHEQSRELLADCHLRAAVDLFAHTWDPVVLAALRDGARRRHHLRTRIGGISDKSLTESLRRLLTNGLITRHVPTTPHVEYTLTPLGATLVDGPMQALGAWIRTHGDALLAAQDNAPQQLRANGTATSARSGPEALPGHEVRCSRRK
ncbi:winged helix-turn-helix transcriptional regulator [Nocardia terpenica]|uniref:Transcriptional regulator n=1 Tax=Nocardia terpenica TaxID=455432 RepID=A0A6G9Z4M7_9NOCA|nr:helix-turn-helix domain-containing protein [Nocardia terpenica]QIS20390.1 transcriptional regulator [Nocardia terpenica]